MHKVLCKGQHNTDTGSDAVPTSTGSDVSGKPGVVGRTGLLESTVEAFLAAAEVVAGAGFDRGFN